METPLLAAAMIAKNEERMLPACLEALDALRPLLSEICIYDTGSTDRTIEIARAAGARVAKGFWSDDFARARNEAIGMCNAKWVLIIDADERVVADCGRLERALREGLTKDFVGVDSAVVTLRNMISESKSDVEWISVRLLRPSRVWYQGMLHEQVVPRPGRKYQRHMQLGHDTLVVKHYGYVGDDIGTVKGMRNLVSAEQEVADHIAEGASPEKLATAILNRGRSHRLKGDDEAAVQDYSEVRRLVHRGQSWLWAGEELATLLIESHRFDEALGVIDEISREGANADLVKWLRARIAFETGDPTQSLELIRQVDVARNSGHMTLPTMDVVKLRMVAAAVCGQHDEVVACGVRLLATHGVGAQYAPLILQSWGQRPAEILAQLFIEADAGYMRGVAEAFMGLGPRGNEVVAALVAIDQARSARRTASTSASSAPDDGLATIRASGSAFFSGG